MKNKIETVLNFLETKTFKNERTIIVVKDEAPETIEDFVRVCHGTDILPDDFRFQTIYNVLERLLELDSNELEEIYDVTGDMVDIYTHDLINWVRSNLTRTGYVDEVMEYTTYHSFSKLLMAAQEREIQEIVGRMMSELECLEV